MTPEDTVRQALALAFDSALLDEEEGVREAQAALEALVAERDALAARLAEAGSGLEIQSRLAGQRLVLMRSSDEGWRAEVAELRARVAALTETASRWKRTALNQEEALRKIEQTAQWYADNDSRLDYEVDHCLCVEIPALARAAADRPTEGGEMDTTLATHDALMEAWGIIANVSEGDWTKQPQEWQDAAVRWRDETFHPAIRAAAYRPEGTQEGNA